jgi:hypothetical protein
VIAIGGRRKFAALRKRWRAGHPALTGTTEVRKILRERFPKTGPEGLAEALPHWFSAQNLPPQSMDPNRNPRRYGSRAEPLQILQVGVSTLERVGIPCMLVGSFASPFHCFPRLTQDADAILELNRNQVEGIIQAFSREF